MERSHGGVKKISKIALSDLPLSLAMSESRTKKRGVNDAKPSTLDGSHNNGHHTCDLIEQ
jgi:hypothetical protein